MNLSFPRLFTERNNIQISLFLLLFLIKEQRIQQYTVFCDIVLYSWTKIIINSRVFLRAKAVDSLNLSVRKLTRTTLALNVKLYLHEQTFI